jgi:DmsE family decaheme c-type cytochrome
MRNLGRQLLILAAVCLLSTARFARAEDAPAKAAAAEKATEVGAATCAGCHVEQAEGFKKSWHGKKLPAMKNLPFEKSCESCHGPGSLHANAAGDHGNAGYATVKISAASNERCLACHNQRAIINWKVSEHNQSGLACAACHKIHSAGENSPKPKSEVCLDCHKKMRMEINLPFHHPIIEGKMECADCHNAHGGDFRNLNAESTRELCVKCHAEKAGPFVKEHPPVAEDCNLCHQPHGSINNSLLKQSQPALCLSCHKQNMNNVGKPPYTNPHSTISEFNTCTDCHVEVHGSDTNSILE